jgi:hypothetical protein
MARVKVYVDFDEVSGQHEVPSRERRQWKAMLRRSRCRSGPAVAVCEEWQDSCARFLLDMGTLCPPGYKLVRINEGRGFEPGNCKWEKVLRHRSTPCNTLYVVVGGERMRLIDLARQLDLDYDALRRRIFRRGLPVGEAIERTREAEFPRQARVDWHSLNIEEVGR